MANIRIRKIGKFGFEDYKRLSPAVKISIAKKSTAKAEQFFKDSFDKQGFEDRNLQRWERSERSTRGGGKTLVDTGSLRKSIRTTRISFRSSKVESLGLAYNVIHNRGGRAGRNLAVTLPKRQFMGNSHKLEKKIKKIFIKGFNRVV